jgi:hypothetical protein
MDQQFVDDPRIASRKFLGMAQNVGHPHRPDRAEATFADEPQQPREFRLIGIVVAGHAHDARGSGTVAQPLAACRVGDRLLD